MFGRLRSSGRTYITWQSAHRPGGGFTNTVSTADGVHFNELGSTDPAGSQGGDVALASTSWPNPVAKTPVGPSGENGVFWGDLGSNTCGPLGIRASVSANQGLRWTAREAVLRKVAITAPYSFSPPDDRPSTNSRLVKANRMISGMDPIT